MNTKHCCTWFILKIFLWPCFLNFLLNKYIELLVLNYFSLSCSFKDYYYSYLQLWDQTKTHCLHFLLQVICWMYYYISWCVTKNQLFVKGAEFSFSSLCRNIYTVMWEIRQRYKQNQFCLKPVRTWRWHICSYSSSEYIQEALKLCLWIKHIIVSELITEVDKEWDIQRLSDLWWFACSERWTAWKHPVLSFIER